MGDFGAAPDAAAAERAPPRTRPLCFSAEEGRRAKVARPALAGSQRGVFAPTHPLALPRSPPREGPSDCSLVLAMVVAPRGGSFAAAVGLPGSSRPGSTRATPESLVLCSGESYARRRNFCYVLRAQRSLLCFEQLVQQSIEVRRRHQSSDKISLLPTDRTAILSSERMRALRDQNF